MAEYMAKQEIREAMLVSDLNDLGKGVAHIIKSGLAPGLSCYDLQIKPNELTVSDSVCSSNKFVSLVQHIARRHDLPPPQFNNTGSSFWFAKPAPCPTCGAER